MKRIFLLLLLGIFSSCANLGNPAFKQAAQSPPPSSGGGSEPSDILPLKIYILNVGQGDSTLIITPRGRTVLIDGGKPGKGREVILPFLESEGIGHLDAIVATHYDADHIGGIPEVIAGKDGELDTADDLRPALGVFDRGGNPLDAAPAYSPYLQAVSPYRKTLQPGDLLPLDSGLVVRCVAANGSILNGAVFDLFQEKIFEAENSSSVALLVEYKNFRYLTAGDLTGGGSPGGFPTLDLEGELAQKVGPVSAVHVNHHGSASSSNPRFIQILQPQVALFSVGNDNEYHHPAQEVLERWHQSGAKLWLTEKGSGGFIQGENVVQGTIELATEGNSLNVGPKK